MYSIIKLFDDINKQFEGVNTTYFGDSILVDKNRYDVIEKPEWKKKRLEAEVNSCKSRIQFFQTQIDNYLQQKQNEENKLSSLQNELNTL
jgi:chromosome segregation ATPase